MQTLRVLAVLMLLTSVAQAFWVGDVDDATVDGNTVPANTVQIDSAGGANHGKTYASPWAAYADTPAGAKIVCGPGTFTCPWVAHTTTPTWSKNISIIGSGSDTNAASNTVFTGLLDANGLQLTGLEMFVFDSVANQEFKNFRMKDTIQNGIRYLHGSGVASSNLLFENLAASNLCHQMPNYGSYATDAGRLGDEDSGGPGQFAIVIQSYTSNVTIKNSLFDDMEGNGICFKQRSFSNVLIQGNEFSNLKAGIVLNPGNTSTGMQILGNTFDNMSEKVGMEQYAAPNSNSGIVYCPRVGGNWLDSVISGNSFTDCGYLADETSPMNIVDPNPHQYENRMLGEAGVSMLIPSGTYAENIMIRSNTFAEVAGDGIMEKGVFIALSNLNGWNFGDNGGAPGVNATHTWSGTPGYVKYITIDNNTFTGLLTDLYGCKYTNEIQDPNAAWASPGVIYTGGGASKSGVIIAHDTNSDGVVNSADAVWDTDLDGDSDIDSADELLAFDKVFKTSYVDFNGDGSITGADFVLWQSAYPTASGAQIHLGDANVDGAVTGADFVLWQAAYPSDVVNFYRPAIIAPVPEPATMALLALGGLALIRRRR